MKLQKWMSSFALIAIVGPLFAACTSQKAPAKLALDDAKKAVDMATTSDTKKYVPDELQALQSTIVGLNASYSIGDYPSVLSGVPPVVVKTQGLLQRAAHKKETTLKDLNAQWREFAVDLPTLVDTVAIAVDARSRTEAAAADVKLPLPAPAMAAK